MTVQVQASQTLEAGIEAIKEASIEDYIDWETQSVQHHIDREGNEVIWTKTRNEQIERFTKCFSHSVGQKYIRIIRSTEIQQMVHCFVVAVDGDNKFRKGDVLKPDGWKTPARNKARGNIFDGDFPMQWTGPLYL